MTITWDDAPPTVTRLICCVIIYGPSGSGRTSLATTAAGPLAYLHNAEKKEFIVEGSSANAQHVVDYSQPIRMHNFGSQSVSPLGRILNPAAVSASSNHVVTEFEQHFTDALNWAGSSIIDPFYDLYQLYQLTELGAMDRESRPEDVKKMGQLVYGKINAKVNALFKTWNAQDSCNLVLVSEEKEVFKGKKGTGIYSLANKDKFWKHAHVVIRTGNVQGAPPTTDPSRYIGDAPKPGYFYAIIEKGWGNAASQGTTFYDAPTTPFGQRWINLPDILAHITGVDASDWGGPIEDDDVEDGDNEDEEPPSRPAKKTLKSLKRKKAVKK